MPKEIDLVQREIQEIRDALEDFKAAVAAGEAAAKDRDAAQLQWCGETVRRAHIASAADSSDNGNSTRSENLISDVWLH